jgi:AAA family ATP:ADP antiporter
LLAFYVLAQVRAPIGLAFYLWLGIFNVLVVSNFWSFANDLYTEDQGKRLFAVIGVGASIGAIVGAFVPHLLHRLLGIHALMLVAASGLGLSIVLYRLVDLRERGHTRRARGATAELRRGLRDRMAASPLMDARLRVNLASMRRCQYSILSPVFFARAELHGFLFAEKFSGSRNFSGKLHLQVSGEE